MQYSNIISYIENIISSILDELGQERLFENPYFSFRGPQYDDAVEIDLSKKDAIRLKIEIFNSGLTIHIGGTNETFEYTTEFIQNNEKLVRKEIQMIFTHKIKEERCGENTTILYFIDKNNIIVRTFKYSGLFDLSYLNKTKCNSAIYNPIFSIN
jgi:hypothetical protein